MRKKTFFAAVFALALLAVAACSRMEQGRQGTGLPIILDASIGISTRAATNGNAEVFETGDQVALYAWTGSSSEIPATRVVDGVVNELQANGSWKPSDDMFWLDFDSPHYFLGIYPARTVSDFKADSFTLNPADYEASDLLAGVKLDGLKATVDPVSLSFNHLMAKFQLNLTFRDQWSGSPTVSAVAATAATSCTVDYLAGTVAPGAPGSVALPKLASAAQGRAMSYGAIMIPQDGFRTITLTVEDQTYVYTHPADLKLVAGKTSVLNLTVGRDRIVPGSMTINEWTYGETYSGEVLNEE